MLALGSDQVSMPVTSQPVVVGSIAAAGTIHVVGRPGLYGLALPPPGNRYGVVGNNLVRLDRDGQVLAVIRSGVLPLNEDTLP